MTEDDFLTGLFDRLPVPPAEVVVPPGDDCAGIAHADGSLTLLAIDQIVGGRHYLLGDAEPTPEAIGKKLLARNLSDIAAMGGAPRYCLVSLATPEKRDAQWLAGLLQGITDLASVHGVHMIGGDLARTDRDEVGSLTIVGSMDSHRVCIRSGACPGCVLMGTGTFGGAVTSGHHLTFSPRLAEGQWLAGTGCIKAMIDVSDGLLLDAARMARASAVKLILDDAKIPPRSAGLTLQNLLGDGEDYELLCAVAESDVRKIQTTWPFKDTPLTVFGRFTSGAPGVYDKTGKDLLELFSAGYDHLSS